MSKELKAGLQNLLLFRIETANKSSRSHAIFEIYLEKISKKNKFQSISSKLRIVDLAGSEKCSSINFYSSKDNEEHISELTSINGSLSALGLWISALADPKRTHVPFRNSKLTKVLKDSLDAKSKIALIVWISPSVDSYKETVSTLQFADRAKKAVLQAQDELKKNKHKHGSGYSKLWNQWQANQVSSSKHNEVSK